MVMNKKEKSKMEELEAISVKYDALLDFMCGERITPDIERPAICSPVSLITGYTFNIHTKLVSIACSSSTSHGIGYADKTNSQRPIDLYSSKELAARAMMVEVKREFYLSSAEALIRAKR